jgi:hypothetical protein
MRLSELIARSATGHRELTEEEGTYLERSTRLSDDEPPLWQRVAVGALSGMALAIVLFALWAGWKW